MITPYGLPKEMIDNYKTVLYPSLWTRLKFYFFGKKIVEYEGVYRFVFYVYKNQLFLTEMKSRYL